MKRALSFFVSLVLLFALMSVVGCHDVEKEVELQAQIDSKSSDLQQVQAANAAIMHVGDSLNTQLTLAHSAIDSLTQVSQKTTKQLASALKEEQQKSDSLASLVATMEPSYCELPNVQKQLADERIARVVAETERDAVKDVAAELTSLIADRYNPWCRKWKHDATERSFIEVMVRSDKAPTPGVSEPVF
ncbi:MAG: hypothetical protein WC495_06600 [Patescibacteria group bacterium]